MSGVQLPAAWALLVCSSGPTPPGDNTRILEDGTERDIEDGSARDIES